MNKRRHRSWMHTSYGFIPCRRISRENRVAWKPGMTTIQIERPVAEFLLRIAERMTNEVMVLLSGRGTLIKAAMIVLRQEVSPCSIYVDSESLATSVARTRALWPHWEVLGPGHLHPRSLGVFASGTDESNVITLGPLLQGKLLSREESVRRLEFVDPGATEWLKTLENPQVINLDKYGRKSLLFGAESLEFKETTVSANILSVTFGPGKSPSRDLESAPSFHGQVLQYVFCRDLADHLPWGACLHRRESLLEGVPVTVVPPDETSAFVWTEEALEEELKTRLIVESHGYHRYRESSIASDNEESEYLSFSTNSPEPNDAESHGSTCRLLDGHESWEDLISMLEEISAELKRRLIVKGNKESTHDS